MDKSLGRPAAWHLLPPFCLTSWPRPGSETIPPAQPSFSTPSATHESGNRSLTPSPQPPRSNASLCRGMARPIRGIDVFAFLDLLVPDQRDVWKVWKQRIADRIVHDTDISFAPRIPTFSVTIISGCSKTFSTRHSLEMRCTSVCTIDTYSDIPTK